MSTPSTGLYQHRFENADEHHVILGGFAVDASALERRFATIPSDVKKASLFYVYLISAFAGVGGFIFGCKFKSKIDQ